MPAIRDFAFSYETATTDAGISIPMCAYASGDLLLVIAMSDTGPVTFSCSNGSGSWTQIFNRTNTAAMTAYWKIAGATEGDITVGGSLNETYNGIVISIRDVNQTNPFGTTAQTNNTAVASANKYALPQITGTVPNSLIITAFGSSVAGVPSMNEGYLQHLGGGDGSAESLGVGWFFRPSTGLCPIPTGNCVAAGAGVGFTIQIAPPTGGATIIPTYTVSDSSILVDYVNGTTAYNGNTAFAATADTNFGTLLTGNPANSIFSGVVLTGNDATPAASADVGINSFNSFARLTNAATANQVSGAEVVIAAANRFNFSSRNLLSHYRPQSPGAYQRLSTLSSKRGILFGVRSNTGSGGATTGYKIWQVGGIGSKISYDAKIPIVINNSAVHAYGGGTLDASVITSVGYWIGGLGALQSNIEFGMIWLMDRIILAGGNATEPIGISSIANIAGLAHSRLSVIQQAANQLLCIQDIQFGDGGTNPTYLLLDSTAIEFPQQYSFNEGYVNYNSVDNKIGITYNAGPSDTIIHRSSILSSPSRYFWGFNSGSSTSATYDFNGLSVIGAGQIDISRPINLSNITIDDYSTLSGFNCRLLSSTITNVPTGDNSAQFNTGSIISGCTLNLAGVATGNYWTTVSSPSIFTNCEFIGGGGHALRVTSTGLHFLTANTFTNFGASGTSGAAIFNDSGGAVTLSLVGAGNTPTFRNGVGASTSISVSYSLTLTNLQSGSEVRAYVGTDPATATELSGVENSTTSFSFNHSVGGQSGYIQIHNTGYVSSTLNIVYSSSDQSIPIQQITDRVYFNP